MSSPAYRLLDANANRAREALRVMEDVARFVLDDAELAAGLKGLRHDLRGALDAAGLDAATLAAWRDTPGDVGTAINTEAEHERASVAQVAVAAGKRLGEALRVLEECGKVIGGSTGLARDPLPAPRGLFKNLRYRAYELERRLIAAFGSQRTCLSWRLCVLITESLCTRPWEDVAQSAIAGGADCLQLREKNLDSGELLRRARRLVGVAQSGGKKNAAVIINDRPDIALLAGADGVHVGQTDLAVQDIRRLAGARLIVGVSTTNLDQAREAVRAGADYCGLGPMFPTTTKHKPDLAGPEYLRAYLAEPMLARVPSLAIGGITPENLPRLIEAGCGHREHGISGGVAVSSAVCGSDDPESVCRRMVELLS